MRYYTIKPPPGLQHVVRCFWVLEGTGAYIHRSMAEVCPEMVFHYNGRFLELKGPHEELSFMAGVQSPSDSVRRFAINNEGFGIFGIYFYPYALPLLTGLPAAELNHQMIDLADLMGQAGVDLKEQMLLAADNITRVEIASEFLLKRFDHSQLVGNSVFQAMRFILETKVNYSIGELADQFCFSRRQFERKFNVYSGFSPKQFSRIVRFQTSIQCYHSQKSLTEIALNCGYYDQAHFIHDFKKFSGYNPKAYFHGDSEGRWIEAVVN